MTISTSRRAAIGAAVLAVAVAGASTAAAAPAQSLVGTFGLTSGSCSGGKARGTYFRMVYPDGSAARGPFFANPDSRCSNTTYTPGRAGTDGGLETGRYQPGPTRTFDGSGNARAASIIAPSPFGAIAFSVRTPKVDPISGRTLPTPSIKVRNGRLSGQITAFTAVWNKLSFNQGSPKPDGTRPAGTSPVRGTYDARTRAFVLEWSSSIVGGPFDGFIGVWHLEGRFTPAS
jgi:hypothetical protein